MIHGMTGFGSAQFSLGGIRGLVEVKSQNHRYLDVVYYLPAGLASLENRMRSLISKQARRGRVTVSVKITDKPLQKLNFNKEAVKEYLKYANVLKKEFGLQNDLMLSDLIRLPGVVEAKETQISADKIWRIIEKSLTSALASLLKMRQREGKSLQADIRNLLNKMSGHIKRIQARARDLLRDGKKRLTDEEFLSFQKGCDINEELIRMAHYIEEFKRLLKAAGSVGKRMDFVAQEMQRETNTIGAKVQDTTISNAVIALKSKIEKLREQAQNIE